MGAARGLGGRAALCVLLVCQVVALGFFVRAYFPFKPPVKGQAGLEDLPPWPPAPWGDSKASETARARPIERTYGRVVFMVIDALRADFVFDPDSAFDYVAREQKKGNMFAFVGRAELPTVTLPRIKALLTGGIPGFWDLLANLNSPALKIDNLVGQMAGAGMRVAMYGDDTWLKLFPDVFVRSEGTTSFYVADYTEVDNNVTHHLDGELQGTGWEGLVLHYLGVDHIGHLAGPASPLLPPKLREMDAIIDSIAEKLYKVDTAQSSQPECQSADAPRACQGTLYVVVGDHGMTSQGNHGGGSPLETQTAVLLMGSRWRGGRGLAGPPASMQQIDVAPTLSLLLGLPIPKGSMGVGVLSVLQSVLSGPTLLAALHYNSHQLLTVLGSMANADPVRVHRAVQAYNQATSAHTVALHSTSDLHVQQAATLYATALATAQHAATSAQSGYDVPALLAGCVLLCLAAACMATLCVPATLPLAPSLPVALATLCAGVGCYLTMCPGLASPGLCAPPGTVWGVLAGAVVVAAAVLAGCLWGACSAIRGRWGTLTSSIDVYGLYMCCGTMLHCLALFGTSFVEEEHQVAYWLLTTMHALMLACALDKLLGANTWPNIHTVVRECGPPMLLLLCARILRSYNQTGDKWRGSPDTALWVTNHPSIHLALLVLSNLLPAMLACAMFLHPNTCTRVSTLPGMATVCLLVWSGLVTAAYKAQDSSMATGPLHAAVMPLGHMLGLVGGLAGGDKVLLARGAYAALAAACLPAWVTRPSTGSGSLLCVLFGLVQLLHRPTNVLLGPVMVAQWLAWLHWAQSNNAMGKWWLGAALGWQAKAAFFQLGNANSISAIDISGAYTGLRDYGSGIVVGLLTALIAFSGPLFWAVALHRMHKNTGHVGAVCGVQGWHSAVVAGLGLAVTLHRHHLFVWSVMAPRLLVAAADMAFYLLLTACALATGPQT